MPYKDPERQADYQRSRYQRVKASYRSYNVKRREKYRAIIREAKSKPCADCNVEYPYYVMDFDHVQPKLFDISQTISRYSTKQLLAEIAKCEVVCANCHRERTFGRQRLVYVG